MTPNSITGKSIHSQGWLARMPMLYVISSNTIDNITSLYLQVM